MRMISIITGRHVARRALGAAYSLIIFMLFTAGAAAQTTTTTKHATDGHTPLEIAPGSPAGSYPLSGFDSINLFNQSLGFRLPLLGIGGRGEAGYTITLPIERKWRVEHKVTNPSIGCSGCEQFIPEHNYRPESDWYAALKPGFSPGVLLVRPTGLDPVRTGSCQGGYLKTLTRLTFVAPDGTEYELRDALYGGSPRPALVSCTEGENRGREFVTADGSSATFISDADIKDRGLPLPDADAVIIDVSGHLYLRDGTRYRISHNRVESIRDRNGNEVRYYYSAPAEGQPGVFVEKAVDSMGREVIINPSTNEITYKGFGGAARTIRVVYAWLSDRLRQANAEHGAETIQAFGNLFPSLPVNGTSDGGYMAADFDAPVVSEVVLPDNRRYGFRYNSYGELARVELPTGGAFEYDYQDGDGVINMGEEYEVFRRVVRKRVYREGGQLEGVTTFTPAGTVAGPGGFDSVVQVDQLDPDPEPSSQCAQPVAGKNYRLISRSLHYYHGMAGPGLFTLPTHYTKWDEGREFKTETYACDGTTLLRRVEQDWRQKAPVGWWTTYNVNERGPEPSNDPRMVETRATLADTGQMAKTTSVNPLNSALVGFDQYNNQTDVWEYDYGGADGSVGAFLRRQHTGYLNTPDYTAVTGAHLRGLPAETWVSSDLAGAAPNRVSRTTYGYDEFPLAACPDIFEQGACAAIFGHDAAYGTSLTKRGNRTSVTSYADAAADARPVTTSARYDVVGNVVKAYDALGRETRFGFGDNFGAPNGEARTNTAPAELAGLPQATRAYAFQTKVINAAGHVGHTQYDYYLGRAVEGEDANNVLTLLRYDDPLDRPTRGVRAFGTAEQTQTTIAYNDAGRTVTVTSDLNGYDDNLLKSETIYDGFGRTTESRQYENATQYILSEQRYDAMGRAAEASYPYRPYQGEAAAWIRTEYDALGRAVAVTTPDGATAGTRYHGPRTLVTDQSGRKRVSEADALGRLSKVWEVTGQDGGTVGLTLPGGGQAHGYLTAYGYDALGNLRTVTQGTQIRAFTYDSLSRLESATNPEVCRQEQSECVPVPVTYDYYADGSLHHKTDARGVVTTYDYDTLGRVTSRTYSDSTPPASYFYDAQELPPGAPVFDRGLSIGRLVAVTYGGGASTAGSYLGGYDAMGRPRLSRQRTDTGAAEGLKTYEMGYGYDPAGNLKTEKYPSGRIVETRYDEAGRVAGVMNQATGFYYAGGAPNQGDSIQYAAHGAVAKMRLGNGLWNHTTFNSRLQPEQSGLGSSAGIDPSKLRLTYGYGPAEGNNGNLKSQRVEGGGLDVTQTYDYDALNRLAWAEEKAGTTSNWKQVFAYDRFGNRGFAAGTTTPGIQVNAATGQLVPDPAHNPVFDASNNRIKVKEPGQGDYRYDEAGNLLCEPGRQCVQGAALTPYYAYDAENKMKSAAGGFDNGGTTYTYDGDGRRVKKATSNGEVTVFVYDIMGRVVAEYSNQAQHDGTSYLTHDHLGSTRVVTAQDQSVRARHDYFPFGEEIGESVGGRATTQGYAAANNVRQKFTGYERDNETGLDFAQARYYSKVQGRFTSPDPLMASAKPIDPQTWNRYAYVLNNPLAYIDPDGLEPTWLQRKNQDGTLAEVKRIDSADRGNYSSGDGWSDVTYDGDGRFVYSASTGDGGVRDAVLFSNGTWAWDNGLPNQVMLSEDAQARIRQNPMQFARTGLAPIDNGPMLRTPDSFTLSVGAITGSGSLTLAGSGNVYAGIEANADATAKFPETTRQFVRPGVCLMANWLNTFDMPGGREIDSFHTGGAAGVVVAGKGLGVGQTWSIGNGTATNVGVCTPGISAWAGTAEKVYSTPLRWR